MTHAFTLAVRPFTCQSTVDLHGAASGGHSRWAGQYRGGGREVVAGMRSPDDILRTSDVSRQTMGVDAESAHAGRLVSAEEAAS